MAYSPRSNQPGRRMGVSRHIKRRELESHVEVKCSARDLAESVEALAHLFEAARRPARVLTDTAASEPELDRMATSSARERFTFIHLATHGVIDEAIPQQSAA